MQGEKSSTQRKVFCDVSELRNDVSVPLQQSDDGDGVDEECRCFGGDSAFERRSWRETRMSLVF